jgi:transposase-like protein
MKSRKSVSWATKTKMWQDNRIGGVSQVSIAEAHDVSVTSVRRWIKQVEEQKGEAPKRKRRKKRNKTPPAIDERLEALEDENAFLKWWNDGERRGFVERLLTALEG